MLRELTSADVAEYRALWLVRAEDSKKQRISTTKRDAPEAPRTAEEIEKLPSAATGLPAMFSGRLVKGKRPPPGA